MRALSLIGAGLWCLSLLLTVYACNESPEQRTSIAASTGSNATPTANESPILTSNDRDRQSALTANMQHLKSQCEVSKRIWATKADSVVDWGVIKNQVQPVLGHNRVWGSVTTAANTMDGASMKLVFDIASTDSQSELRDQRIASIVFGREKGTELSFVLTDLTAASGVYSYPDIGNTVSLVGRGKLSIAGHESTVEVPLFLTHVQEGLRITNSNEPLRLDLTKELGLGTEIKQICDLVGVTLEPQVELRFDIMLIDVCSG